TRAELAAFLTARWTQRRPVLAGATHAQEEVLRGVAGAASPRDPGGPFTPPAAGTALPQAGAFAAPATCSSTCSIRNAGQYTPAASGVYFSQHRRSRPPAIDQPPSHDV